MLANPLRATGNRVYELGEANSLAGIHIELLSMSFKGVYKTIKGTIPESSSLSPFATEAAYGVKLLLF